MIREIENAIERVKSGDVVIGKPGVEKERYKANCEYYLFRYKNKTYFTTDNDVFEHDVRTRRLMDLSDKNITTIDGYDITSQGRLYKTDVVKIEGIPFITSKRVKKVRYITAVIDSVGIGLTIKNDFIVSYRNISEGIGNCIATKGDGTINDETKFILLGLKVFGINVLKGEIFLISDYTGMKFADDTMLTLTTRKAFTAKNVTEAFSDCTVHKSNILGDIKMELTHQ